MLSESEPLPEKPAPDPRFSPSLWKAMVFDGWECPSADSCPSRHAVPFCDRKSMVLPWQPDFHIVTGDRSLTEEQERIIREAIPLAVELLTGEEFAGRVTRGKSAMEQEGWIDIVPVSDGPCGMAPVGALMGRIELNVERLDTLPCPTTFVFKHELGHALGFWHTQPGYLMSRMPSMMRSFTDAEIFHARRAFEIGRNASYAESCQRAQSGFE